MVARWSDLSIKNRVLHVPEPKGGPRRAFDLYLSRAMLRCIADARRAGSLLHAEQARTWIFPAATKSGHIAEWREDRSVLPKYGSDLRQTYRTAAAQLEIPDIDVMVLMNHVLPMPALGPAASSVSVGYITRSALAGHLLRQQEKISRHLLEAMRS